MTELDRVLDLRSKGLGSIPTAGMCRSVGQSSHSILALPI